MSNPKTNIKFIETKTRKILFLHRLSKNNAK